MRVELKKTYRSDALIEELDSLVVDAIELYTPKCSLSGLNIERHNTISTVIHYHLIEETNFLVIFDRLLSSYGDNEDGAPGIISSTLCDLKKGGSDPTFENFLNHLNERVEQIKAKSIKKFTLYIPTLLLFQFRDAEKMDKIKKEIQTTFGVKIRHPPKKIFKRMKNAKFRTFYQNRRVVFRVDVEARDYHFAADKAFLRMKAAAGAIALAENYGSYKTRWAAFSSDRPLILYPFEPFHVSMIVENNDTIVYPSERDWIKFEHTIRDDDISTIRKKKWKFASRRDKLLFSILTAVKKQNKYFASEVRRFLELYFEASVEKDLFISFFKFWVLAEAILKIGGGRNDESIIGILKKVTPDKHIKKLIDDLYRKRNKLVHEFQPEGITQHDRNLIKLIAEHLLLYVIDPPIRIRNKNELKIMFDNTFYKKEELVLRNRIIRNLANKYT